MEKFCCSLPGILKDLPLSEADKIKIAFTEGYIASNPNAGSGGQNPNGGSGGQNRIRRLLRAFPQLLGIACSVVFLLYMFGIVNF